LETIVIPNSVTSILNSAFQSCIALTSATIGNSVASISSSVFQGCSLLETIVIPDSVTSIGSSVFQDCIALTSATIGNSVASIVSRAFYGCSVLESVIIGNSVITIGAEAFYQCSALSSISIPNSVTSIGTYVFQSCIALTSASIGNSVTSIGEYAFGECSALASIIIPNSVISIGDTAFYGCSLLASVTIGNSVNFIDGGAFQNCIALSSIIFLNQNNLGSTQGSDVFGDTGNITSVTFYNTANEAGLSVGGQTLKDDIDSNNTSPPLTYTYIAPPPPPPCFLEGSMILTDKGYLPIQNLRNGDLIKTLKHNFKPINMIGKREINHPASKERIKSQLYKFSQKEYPEIFEPLVITGCHSILVNKFESEEQREKTKQVNGELYVTDGKYRLPACAHPTAPVYETPGNYTIYHLALENDDYYMNYGIYANGLLVETCSKRYLKELSNMTLIE
jgi:hypothetical protein